jgi:putative membrane protein
MGIPRWARRLVSSQDRARIEECLRKAEAGCGAELVPVIVRRSSAVGHVGLSAGLTLLLGLYVVRNSPWGPEDSAWQSWAATFGQAALAAFLGWLLGRFSWVQRLFITRHDRERSVDRRARLEFYKQHVETSATGYGVLLYVSLMERKAVVLCGPHLASKVPSQDWHEVVRLMGQGAKNGRLGEGMAAAIAKGAELMKAHLPSRRRPKGAWKDKLVIKE